MRDDLVAAIRSLRAAPGFTVVALVILTLGIGAATTIFSVVDAVVLRGLPFDENDRLVAVGERSRADQPAGWGAAPALRAVAPQNYADWALRQRDFKSMAAVASGWLTLRLAGVEPESLVPQRVTASFFDVLRVRPAIGRAFTVESEVDGQHRVAVLSDGLWRRRFGGDPAVVGRVIPIEDVEGGPAAGPHGYEVIGVMPPDFSYPIGAARPTDVWVPYVVPADQRTRRSESFARYLQVIARLGPGVSVEQAQAQMTAVAARLEQEHPDWNKDSGVGVIRLADHIVGASLRSWMLLLLGAVGLVQLIVCANVAGLLLARASSRSREMGIRAALGAGRWRLMRQMLVESLVLAAAGTALALAFATWGIDALRTVLWEQVPRVTTIALDLRVLAAAAGLSLITGITFGLVPAMEASRLDLVSALRAARTSGRAGRRVRAALVVAEVALAVVLVVGASLFIASFATVLRIDPGFDPEGVLTTQVSPRVGDPHAPRDVGPVIARIVEEIASAPGVVAAAATGSTLPLTGGLTMTTMRLPGTDLRNSELVVRRSITPAYHEVLRIPLRAGRYFTAADRQGSLPVAILADATARQLFPGIDPVGRAVVVDGERVVVGVVGDVRQLAIEIETRPEVYVPMAQATTPGAMLVVRTATEPAAAAVPAVRQAVFAAMPDVPLRNTKTMGDVVASTLARRKVSMMLLGLFGLLGLAIASAGIYGVLSHTVAAETRDIGVRVALGATRRHVLSAVVGRSALMVGAGMLLGTLAARQLGTVVGSFVFGIEPGDPRVYAAALAVLAAAAAAASLVPALRATKVDPLVALRAE